MSDQPSAPPVKKALTPLVTQLAPITEQVGTHVLQALQDAETVAALTTVVAGFPADRVVSLPLTNAQLASVQKLLMQVQAEPAPQTEEEEARCIGFQCQIPDAT